MFNNISNSSKAVAKVAGKGVLKFFILFFMSIIFFLIGFTLYGISDDPKFAENISLDIWPILLCIVSVLFPFIYFTLINKSVIQGALHSLWKTNLEGWFTSKVSNYTETYFTEGTLASSINDKAKLKLKLVNDIKNDKSNSRWQRKILSFTMKKVKLDEFDHSQENANLSDFISQKATGFVSDLGKPNSTFLFVFIGVHILLLVLAIIFNK